MNYIASDIFSEHLLTEFDFSRTRHFAGDDSSAAEASAAFRIFAAHQMPAAGAMTLKLAGGGNLDSLAQTLMALLLRHSTISSIGYIRDRAPKRPFAVELFGAKNHKLCSLCHFTPKVNTITGGFF